MTIPLLSISLKGVFEYGQAYAALSRAVNLKQLVLMDFHEHAFIAHPKVKAFYKLIMGA
jgi:ATP-dependent exoDNAse (exonuclease V) alpha subunit